MALYHAQCDDAASACWYLCRSLGLARSRNGVTWAKVPEFRIEGDQPWNSKILADPTVEPQSDATIRVWFGGGDVASPDQNLNGQIGVGILH